MAPNLTKFALTLLNFTKNPSESTFSEWIQVANEEGAVAQKVAQVLSQRGEIVPQQWKERVQSHVCANIAVHDWAWSKKKLNDFAALRPEFRDILAVAQEMPIASGTIAQVHLAGQYAVKILHPGLEAEIQRWREALRHLRRAFSLAGFDALGRLVQFGVMAVEMQLDMRQELKNMREIAQTPAVQALVKTGRLLLPAGHAADKHVLVMENINARTLASLGQELKISRPKDLETLRAGAFLTNYVFTTCTVGEGMLTNCDLHPGNIGCCLPETSADGQLERQDVSYVIYDYGMCCEWSAKYLKTFKALLSADIVGTFLSILGEERKTATSRCLRNAIRKLHGGAESATTLGFAQLYEDCFKELLAQDLTPNDIGDEEAVVGFCHMLVLQHLNEGLRAVDLDYREVKAVANDDSRRIQSVYELAIALLVCAGFDAWGLPLSTCCISEELARTCREAPEEVCSAWKELARAAQPAAVRRNDGLRVFLLKACGDTLVRLRAQ